MIVAAALAITAGLGWLDLITGPEIGFSLFYLVPILACGWWAGRLAALIMALCAAAAWFAAEIASRPAADLSRGWRGASSPACRRSAQATRPPRWA